MEKKFRVLKGFKHKGKWLRAGEKVWFEVEDVRILRSRGQIMVIAGVEARSSKKTKVKKDETESKVRSDAPDSGSTRKRSIRKELSKA